jgi:hypothetical protein
MPGFLDWITLQRGLPPPIRSLRRRHREVWDEGEAMGHVRAIKFYEGKTKWDVQDMARELVRGQDLGEEAAYTEFLRLSIQKGVNVNPQAEEAYVWAFAQGWTAVLLEVQRRG